LLVTGLAAFADVFAVMIVGGKHEISGLKLLGLLDVFFYTKQAGRQHAFELQAFDQHHTAVDVEIEK